jgi:aminoglycoside 3-N-acetyltransferase I
MTEPVDSGGRLVHMRIRRLGRGDEDLARDTFAMMASVFDEAVPDLGVAYVATLLARTDFWAMVALDGEEVVGGLTAHALPMTRSPEAELFIYDLAVRADRQRRGIGRALVLATLDRAKAEGLRVAFVPADDEDGHAIEFYRALGGRASPVTFFTFGGE